MKNIVVLFLSGRVLKSTFCYPQFVFDQIMLLFDYGSRASESVDFFGTSRRFLFAAPAISSGSVAPVPPLLKVS